MKRKSEFTIINAYQYNDASPARWIISHLTRYIPIILGYVLLALLSNICAAFIPVVTGTAFTVVLQKQLGQLGLFALILLVLAIGQGGFELGAHYLAEILGQRFTHNTREELYRNLLGKSQTFHNRQRVGEVMARISRDMVLMSSMVAPAFDFIFLSFSSLLITLAFIGHISLQLLLVPVLYSIVLIIAVRSYSRQLIPSTMNMGMEFGAIDAVLSEAVAGIELVKAAAQEEQEMEKFLQRITHYRDLFIENARVQGRFLPNLFFGIALALALLHSIFLLSQHLISLGEVIAFMGLMINLRSLTSFSYWTFAVVQSGVAGAQRVLALIHEDSELDENEDGYRGEMHGDIVFDHVSFRYGETTVLQDISFHARPGQTVAIVGQIGAGKSSLTKLVNRIYDVDAGRILLDNIDVRDWNLDVLRSQIATIEQDVFLFSRSIAENIAYGLGENVDQAAIEQAAQAAQAHAFIQSFPYGYQTEIGERGVTLSGGQRQRLAIARALLTDPRVLILDDATSAIDSATEDEIQKAIKRVQQGRTTLLITYRLSQIRWADSVLVIDQGRLLDQGTHEELMERCAFYHRLFSHYESPAVAALQ
ncbi:MAG TPA: ABC transporter ATP-binding protein [Ktedonobacteraceae bacterium]|nr:ABC transporter ATP-binding protein [Ktedonobacteraceae bacterium]